MPLKYEGKLWTCTREWWWETKDEGGVVVNEGILKTEVIR